MLSPIAALKKAAALYSRKLRELNNQQAVLHQEYARIKRDISLRTPDNPAIYGYKIYSQFDEDGIIAHIFSRIGAGDHTFMEIGCSDGLENNTHALLLQGWRGIWVDADTKKINYIAKHLPPSPRLVIKQAFVSANNTKDIVSEVLAKLGAQAVDFLSVDIDGDDLNVLVALLKHVTPRVICAEYNAKFPPPMKIAIRYRPDEFWNGDDYHGASLSALEVALREHGYRLVSCGATGVNAFFVRADEADKFPQFTAEQMFQPAIFDLRLMTSGHPASLKFLADQLSKAQDL